MVWVGAYYNASSKVTRVCAGAGTVTKTASTFRVPEIACRTCRIAKARSKPLYVMRNVRDVVQLRERDRSSKSRSQGNIRIVA